jgi:hypothetical protein
MLYSEITVVLIHRVVVHSVMALLIILGNSNINEIE